MTDARWHHRARCAGEDPQWWTHDGGKAHWPDAVRACIECPVQEECDADADATGDTAVIRAGVWRYRYRNRDLSRLLVCACGKQPVTITERVIGHECASCAAAREQGGEAAKKPYRAASAEPPPPLPHESGITANELAVLVGVTPSGARWLLGTVGTEMRARGSPQKQQHTDSSQHCR
jgi:hypothetical protein